VPTKHHNVLALEVAQPLTQAAAGIPAVGERLVTLHFALLATPPAR
jgi:hypothetical protein